MFEPGVFGTHSQVTCGLVVLPPRLYGTSGKRFISDSHVVVIGLAVTILLRLVFLFLSSALCTSDLCTKKQTFNGDREYTSTQIP